MSALADALADYLAVRRALGFKLRHHGRLLGQFVEYLEGHGRQQVTVADALAWATLPAGSVSWWSDRLSVARGFAAYLHTLDPAHQLLPFDLLPARRRRVSPHLYTDEEVAALIEATEGLRFPHRRATFRTLICLLSASGMRVGEAIGLDRGDFDPEHGSLIVRAGKFGKSRELPLKSSTVAALRSYLERSDRPGAARRSAAMLVSTTGSRLAYCGVQRTFRRLCEQAGVGPHAGGRPPRLHDLRHTFAVCTILDAYREGAEVSARLPLLSTYLGHVDPKATYWYLQAAPELLQLAAERRENYRGGQQ